jgi:hypothetical protein
MAGLVAQKDKNPTDQKKKLPKPKKQDVILFNLNWMTWLNSPDSMSVSPFSRGFDFALMWDVPLGRSPMSFAAGVNFSFENYFSNSFITDSAGGNSVYFRPISPIINADNPDPDREWRKYKMSTALIELPIELRFRLKPHKRNTFKWAVGFKIGYVIDSWQKYEGPDYRMGENLNESLRQVTYGLPGINRFRYGVYTRIGYSRYHLYVHYGIGDFFLNGKGVNGSNNLTIGLSLTPF